MAPCRFQTGAIAEDLHQGNSVGPICQSPIIFESESPTNLSLERLLPPSQVYSPCVSYRKMEGLIQPAVLMVLPKMLGRRMEQTSRKHHSPIKNIPDPINFYPAVRPLAIIQKLGLQLTKCHSQSLSISHRRPSNQTCLAMAPEGGPAIVRSFGRQVNKKHEPMRRLIKVNTYFLRAVASCESAEENSITKLDSRRVAFPICNPYSEFLLNQLLDSLRLIRFSSPSYKLGGLAIRHRQSPAPDSFRSRVKILNEVNRTLDHCDSSNGS